MDPRCYGGNSQLATRQDRSPFSTLVCLPPLYAHPQLTIELMHPTQMKWIAAFLRFFDTHFERRSLHFLQARRSMLPLCPDTLALLARLPMSACLETYDVCAFTASTRATGHASAQATVACCQPVECHPLQITLHTRVEFTIRYSELSLEVCFSRWTGHLIDYIAKSHATGRALKPRCARERRHCRPHLARRSLIVKCPLTHSDQHTPKCPRI